MSKLTLCLKEMLNENKYFHRIMDDEQVIFEALSGPRQEDVQHTYGDTLKNMEALTSIIFLKAYKLPNECFSTLTRYKSICIHSIKRTLTLSVMSVINDTKKKVCF